MAAVMEYDDARVETIGKMQTPTVVKQSIDAQGTLASEQSSIRAIMPANLQKEDLGQAES